MYNFEIRVKRPTAILCSKIIFVLLLFACLLLNSQEKSEKSVAIKHPVYISAGAHIGFWSKDGQYGIPYNVQADMLMTERFVIGLGYTYDAYKGNPYFFSTRTRPGSFRTNVNIRFYRYFIDPQKVLSLYLGFSGGVSYWTVRFGVDTYPTSQFLFGLKLKIYKGTFWLTEFAVGPPYMCQSSLGVKF
jgi:hypothetical protein